MDIFSIEFSDHIRSEYRTCKRDALFVARVIRGFYKDEFVIREPHRYHGFEGIIKQFIEHGLTHEEYERAQLCRQFALNYQYPIR